jgi:hypothetical protein
MRTEVYQGFNTGTIGLVDLASVSMLSNAELFSLQGASGNVLLATLNFTASNTGSTALAFDWTPGNEIVTDIAAVPEPGTILLLCAGLMGLLLFRRERGQA